MLRQTLGRVPPLYRFANRLRGYRINSPEVSMEYELLGSWYGAWPAPLTMLDRQSIVYGFGVGEDITFDLALIRRVGCNVFAFDPTPIAGRWLEGQRLPPEFIFSPVGLAEDDGEMDFFVPNDAHSFSRNPTGKAAKAVKCPVRTLKSLMSERNHGHIDLLKMDIEGFEYGVIPDFLSDGIRPRVINVEFHHKSYGIPAGRTLAAVSLLHEAGYRIFWMSDVGREYGFVLQSGS